MDMTGTFMPAYGLNRLFGELPLVGAILGNGRDRGLIGVTFKLDGDADSPHAADQPAVGRSRPASSGRSSSSSEPQTSARSGRPHEDVLLLAERELDDAVGRQVGLGDRSRRSSLTGWSLRRTAPPWIWRRASPFEAASPAVTNSDRMPMPAVELGCRSTSIGRQVSASRAFLEGLARRLGGLLGRRRGHARWRWPRSPAPSWPR